MSDNASGILTDILPGMVFVSGWVGGGEGRDEEKERMRRRNITQSRDHVAAGKQHTHT